jgi:SAM-dependent MidA family methyltransferase
LSTPQLLSYFSPLKIDLLSNIYPEGYRTEINLAAIDWITTIANKLHQGFVLTIDYGYSADRYYTPTRSSGTLQCYYQHRHHNNPYIYIGKQDITAHVDFTALEKQGELLELEVIGFTQQALFLMALGLGDRIAANSQTPGQNLSEVLRRRDSLHSLINPMGLGGFGVLIQGKRLTASKPIQLKGLTIPQF